MNNQRHSPPHNRKPAPPARPTGRSTSRSGRNVRDNRPIILLVVFLGIISLVVIIAAYIFIPKIFAAPTPLAYQTSVNPGINTLKQTEVITSTPFSAATITSDDSSLTEAYSIDVPYFQQYMFNLINQDRQQNGLSLVVWDTVAGQAGARHAKEMTAFQYLSHWNLDGYGPEYRYIQAGGLNISQENVFFYQHSKGAGPLSNQDWEALVKNAELKLMQSPGHRANILAPAHTHVGIGIDYDPIKGRLSISQEFVDKYVDIQPLPTTAILGQVITLKGKLTEGINNPVINLGFEPQPQPKNIEELNKTSTYTSPAQIYHVLPLNANADGNFTSIFPLNNNNQVGLYHIYIGGTDQFGESRMILDFVINVTGNP